MCDCGHRHVRLETAVDQRATCFVPSGGGNNLQTSFHIVGDDGAADLHSGLGKPAPSHAPKTIASLPRAEDILDPAIDTIDRLVSSI